MTNSSDSLFHLSGPTFRPDVGIKTKRLTRPTDQLLLHGGCMWLLLNNKFISCLQALSYKSSAVRVTLHYRNVGILKTSAGVFAVMSTPTVSKCDVSVVKNIWDFIWKSLITLAVQARGSLISCTDTSWRIFIKIRQNYWDASPLPDQAGDVNAVANDTLSTLGSLGTLGSCITCIVFVSTATFIKT